MEELTSVTERHELYGLDISEVIILDCLSSKHAGVVHEDAGHICRNREHEPSVVCYSIIELIELLRLELVENTVKIIRSLSFLCLYFCDVRYVYLCPVTLMESHKSIAELL